MKDNFFGKIGRFTAVLVAVSMIGGISAAYAAPPQPGKGGPEQPAPHKPAPKPAPPKPAPQPAPHKPAPAPHHHDDGKDDFVKGAITGAVLGVVIDRVIK